MNPPEVPESLALGLSLVVAGGYVATAALVWLTDCWPAYRRNRQTAQINRWLARRQERECRQRL